MFWIGLLTAALILGADGLHLTGRSTTYKYGRLSFDIVNPITVGMVGATILLSAAAWLERGPTRLWALLLVAGALVGGVVLVESGSRGPLVSVAITLAALAALRRRWRGLVLAGVIALQNSGAVMHGLRFGNPLAAASIDQRLDYQGLALRLFMAHPIFGSYYTETGYGFYPHNLLVEAAMSLGLVGLLLAAGIVARGLFLSVRAVGMGLYFAPMMFLAALLQAQMSGAIWNSCEVWLPLIVVMRLCGGGGTRRLGPRRPRGDHPRDSVEFRAPRRPLFNQGKFWIEAPPGPVPGLDLNLVLP